MEKFAVDLDKVLDEFEFSEEQAVKQRNIRREDLPAAKYQKPHFQPINIADADFKPSDQTIKPTQPILTYKNDLNKEIKVPNIEVVEQVINHEEENDEEQEVEEDGKQEDDISQEESESDTTGLLSVPDDTISTQLTEITNVSLTEKDSERSVNSDDSSVTSFNLQIDTSKLNPENVELLSDIDDAVPDVKFVVTDNKPDIVLSSTLSDEKIPNENESDHVENNVGEDLVKFESPTNISDEEFRKYLLELEDLEREECEEDVTGSSNKSEPVDDTETTGDKHDVQGNLQNNLEIQNVKVNEETQLCEKAVRPVHLELTSTQELVTVSAGFTPLPKNTHSSLPEISSGCSNDENNQDEEETVKLVNDVGTVKADEDVETANVDESAEPVKVDDGAENKTETCPQIEENDLPTDTDDSDDSFRNRNDVLTSQGSEEATGESSCSNELSVEERQLGKVIPYWVPDNDAPNCMNCSIKFTVIRRKHHCRACGKVLCSKCCNMRAMLEYLDHHEQRVCEKCFQILAKVLMYEVEHEGCEEEQTSPKKQPNPNNPMEYCSTVSPLLQVSTSSSGPLPPPSVLVPVGVLKREGSSGSKSKDATTTKQVMFSDGIRPGGDLTELDGSSDRNTFVRKTGRVAKRVGTPPGTVTPSPVRLLPPVDPTTQSFIVDVQSPPPVCVVNKGEVSYQDHWPRDKLLERLRDTSLPPLMFAVNRNLTVSLQVVKLDCCMNKTCWVMNTHGMSCVGQDEIVIILSLTDDCDEIIPVQVFLQLHFIYQDAAKGNTVIEMGSWCVKESCFLDSREHGGFLFIRPTFQCLKQISLPPAPYLIGLLIHRFEIPWAKVFPIRLMLRLGAEMKYYPCPLVSVRFREPVYMEVGHTIINLLADFRNFSYTLPTIRGLKIHMEAKQMLILIPRNRYDQVVRALNNSNDPVLALAGNFSQDADSHLICIQSKGDEVTYTTHAINIYDKPKEVTGASFVVFNGALKSTSGRPAKISIVEDGLMIQVPSETMTHLRAKLKNMEEWSVTCGLTGTLAENQEVVKIVWTDDDKCFNIGVKSVVDNMSLDGIPSIRVHSGTDYMGTSRFIRWTEVFIIKCEDGATSAKIGDPIEVNKMSESIARATCLALIKLLDMLASSGLNKLAVRATIDQENVGYEAGSNGERLAPIYMNSLDNELIPVLHKAVSLNDSVAVLELVFHIMNQ